MFFLFRSHARQTAQSHPKTVIAATPAVEG